MWVSIIINIILCVALFFKSALNDIAKEKWLEKKRDKKETIKRLADFRTLFSSYNQKNFLMLINLGRKLSLKKVGGLVDSYIENSFQSNFEESGKLKQEINNNLVYLPKDIQENFREYEVRVTEILEKIFKGNLAEEDYINYCEILMSFSSKCLATVESKLNSELNL